MAAENNKQFWKRSAKLPGSIQPVYGAQHPPLDPRLTKNFIKERSKVNSVPLKNKKASSFHEFARNTSDAWDIGDDEEEDFSSPPFQTLNSKVALATAAQVLENHSKLRVKPERSQSTTSDVPASYKVIKSSSDAQLSRNSSDTCLRNPLHKQQSLPLRPIIPLVARISDQNASGAPPMTVREKTRLEKFRQLLSSHNTDLDELRKWSWPGVPREVRPVTWRLLSGYLPANTERRKLTLQRKREEYFGFIEQYYDSRNEEHHQDTYRQIHIDIPRTNPLIPLFQQPLVQEIFERILFIWAIRHPASGYVQGINDLVTPFFVVFLSEYVDSHGGQRLSEDLPCLRCGFYTYTEERDPYPMVWAQDTPKLVELCQMWPLGSSVSHFGAAPSECQVRLQSLGGVQRMKTYNSNTTEQEYSQQLNSQTKAGNNCPSRS